MKYVFVSIFSEFKTSCIINVQSSYRGVGSLQSIKDLSVWKKALGSFCLHIAVIIIVHSEVIRSVHSKRSEASFSVEV